MTISTITHRTPPGNRRVGPTRRPWRHLRLAGAAALVAIGVLVNVVGGATASNGCSPGPTAVACENALAGTPSSEWQVQGAGDPSIQGFATQISVNAGETQSFKVKTDAADYRLDIYRIGYYGGDGARLVDTVTPSATLPQTQPDCLKSSSTGLIDCGNWGVSASWQVPADAVSGVYMARPVRADTNGASQILFVVRNDSRSSALLFQTSDTAWNAYNAYGGVSLYDHSSVGSGFWPSGNRGYKVSYNRPLTIRDYEERTNFFYGEYPMVRFLERNGYDVSYFTGVDTATRGAEILNHKTFLSVGHDEYWSAEQRASVEHARDAGVNLAFFSGNEMFWKTRWEPSTDASATPMRTLVSYKETYLNTRSDPSGVWTGTWRDPRFSPPADGGKPENAVTGTLYRVGASRTDAMKVPATYGKLRFWRNTGVDTLAAGSSATLPSGVLGYEWDEDADNGFRPPGLIDLSSTTLAVGTYLLNHGTVYGDGTATHSLTLYRAASGALVFGAGTVQWSWGLDGNHDIDGPNADRRMQQATVNLLADMSAQPQTLMTNLTDATKSTDTTPPSVSITSPSAGASVARGASVTISGTANDPGAGVVGGVEVSTDGGTTWHPAKGQDSWTYTWVTAGFGPTTIVARATDDSGNIGPTASRGVAVGGCPCSIWSDATLPSTTSSGDRQAYELGMRFRADVDGFVSGVRFYKGSANTGTHLGHLWSNSGTLLGTVQFKNETATGWQTAYFSAPIAVSANTTYVISYWAPSGGYALDRPFFSAAVNNVPLHALADGADGGNGVFKAGTSAFPTQAAQSSNYWVDIVYDTVRNDRVPPNVVSTKPVANAPSASLTAAVQAQFDEPLDPASVNGSSAQLTGPGGTVAATVSFDGATNTLSMKPTSALAQATTYTATIQGGSNGVTDTGGNRLPSDYSWSFTTFALGSCPCSIWSTTAIPATASYNDGTSYELGVKVRADMSGFITGIRFYKGDGNTGTHIGHLWTASGQMLGQFTFRNETGTGWQQGLFATPIAINADTTYIASYYAPAGHYALDRPGLATSVDTGILHALADGFDGGNAVFKSGASGFPTTSKQSSNYWVDVVFRTDNLDEQGPNVVSNKPVTAGTNIGARPTIQATFDERLAPSSVTTGNAELRTSAGSVAAAVSYDAATSQVTLTPAGALSPGTTYTVVMHGGAGGLTDVAGNPMPSDYTWSFSTFSCPCSLWQNSTNPANTSYPDTGSYELGFKFRSDISGYISGIRFYKGSGNTGTHVGHLWSSTGTMLGAATFMSETATGWQQVLFSSPIPINANTTYVASYYAPKGGYAMDRPYFTNPFDNGILHALADGADGGNGVFKSGTIGFPTVSKQATNYWVDVVFTTTP